jgi:ribosomal protein S18 acetylase RimI-like enzyme
MSSITYKRLSIRNLSEIKPLWEELNKIHLADSVHFKEHYQSFSFETRSSKWMKLQDADIFIIVAQTDDSAPIGYCVSTIDIDKNAEIDSLFVDTNFRQQGIGRELIEKSKEWFQKNNCISIRLSVSYGHECVLPFYMKSGFFPRLTTLEFKK